MLFDSGLSGGKPLSALAANAQQLGAALGDLDAVVISHLHADHVGGVAAMRRRTFAFAAEPLEPRGVPAYVPAPMRRTMQQIRTFARRAVDASAVALSIGGIPGAQDTGLFRSGRRSGIIALWGMPLSN